jgi:hypothetical protein
VCSLDGQVNIGRQPSNWPRTGARDCNSSHLDMSLRQLFNGSHAKGAATTYAAYVATRR